MAGRGQLLLRSGRTPRSWSPGEWARFLLVDAAPRPESGFLGLYEHSFAWSRRTQFSHGCSLSQRTFRWRQGQQAVPYRTLRCE
jgi:hypothetical protein